MRTRTRHTEDRSTNQETQRTCRQHSGNTEDTQTSMTDNAVGSAPCKQAPPLLVHEKEPPPFRLSDDVYALPPTLPTTMATNPMAASKPSHPAQIQFPDGTTVWRHWSMTPTVLSFALTPLPLRHQARVAQLSGADCPCRGRHIDQKTSLSSRCQLGS